MPKSADGGLERVSKGGCLCGGQLDNEPPTTFERNAHDDATPFLSHLERTVARPRLHGGHALAPSVVLLFSKFGSIGAR
jgi:hypothetical protein